MNTEYELFKRYRETKDKKIRDELVLRYTYMANILAHKYNSAGIEFEDVYQVACMGVVLAVERFDPDRGVQFATFATPTILGEIRRFMRDKAKCIKIPRKLYEVFCRAEELKKHSGQLSPEEIAHRLDMPVKTVEEAYRIGDAAFIKSLEDEANTDGGLSLAGMLGFDDRGFTVIENHDFMQYCMSRMTDREAELFRERFYGSTTQRELSQKWGVSQMYVSRLEKKVVEKFKNIYLEDIT